MRLLADQRGSITPVFVALFAATVMLMMAFLERDWVNYSLKMAEQTADFAAEVGSRTHIAWATVKVTRKQVYTYFETVCDQRDPVTDQCVAKHEEPRTGTNWDFAVKSARELELRENWRDLAGCTRDNPWAPAWQCTAAEVQRQWITFPDAYDDAVFRTFWANWPARSAVTVTLGEVIPVFSSPTTATTTLRVRVQVRSLFGVFRYSFTNEVVGSAVVRLNPLVLN